MKTISADDLLKEIDDFLEILGLERNGHYACGYLDGVLKIKNMIKRQSAVEAERTGQWVNDSYGIVVCSNCKFPALKQRNLMSERYVYKTDYCPNCGSKMDGE
ncbi:MAG: hypothetical protein IKW14_07670 [Phascolarctobacterium sp.]|nr:hypothetical protein [Phascolarctobacterium sp.]